MFGRFAKEGLFSPKKVVSVVGINIVDQNFHQKQPVGKKTPFGREMSPFGSQMPPFQSDVFFSRKKS